MEFSLTGKGGFLSPQKIIDDIGIVDGGMSIADFGCGHGYFSLLLAKRVGSDGKIFALDVVPEALKAIESRMKLEGIQNIEMKRCNLEKEKGSGLLDASCDVVWLANLLFQTEDDEVVIKEVKRVLKQKGIAVFIDWRPGVPLGPQGKRVKPEKIKILFESNGFLFERDFPTDNYHFGMVFKKSLA